MVGRSRATGEKPGGRKPCGPLERPGSSMDAAAESHRSILAGSKPPVCLANVGRAGALGFRCVAVYWLLIGVPRVFQALHGALGPSSQQRQV